uniref:C2H2-type domain-containing protein n=1 Tax=Gouania willdenowi TaxID=441366 RepID=A0A8C5E540_GOUWI
RAAPPPPRYDAALCLRERKFQCSTCGKFFHQSSHLMTHRRLHTGEKPFQCKYCEKAFTQKAGLQAHIRLHTEDKTYTCENCGAGFRSMSVLLSHKAQEASGEAKPASRLGSITFFNYNNIYDYL